MAGLGLAATWVEVSSLGFSPHQATPRNENLNCCVDGEGARWTWWTEWEETRSLTITDSPALVARAVPCPDPLCIWKEAVSLSQPPSLFNQNGHCKCLQISHKHWLLRRMDPALVLQLENFWMWVFLILEVVTAMATILRRKQNVKKSAGNLIF